MSATPVPTAESVFQIILNNIPTVVTIIIVAAIAIGIERTINRYVSGFGKKARLQPQTTNNLMLTTRIIILLVAIAAIAKVGGLPPEWILSVSAIGGAAIGFASQKTIGNFIAGIFIIFAHPFKVGEYVRIGTVEGIVSEITINYTKVATSANNTISISNLQILDRDITNFIFEPEKTGRAGTYCYTFEIGFDHNVSCQKIEAVFEQVFKNHLMELPRKPSFSLVSLNVIGRVYLVYLYVRKPEDIGKFRTQITEEVYTLWDQQRT